MQSRPPPYPLLKWNNCASSSGLRFAMRIIDDCIGYSRRCRRKLSSATFVSYGGQSSAEASEVVLARLSLSSVIDSCEITG